MHRHSFKLLLLLSFFLAACNVTPTPASEQKVMMLTKLLRSLDVTIAQKEALRLSRDIFQQTTKLTKAFELTSPPWFHNVLVNIGLREKGLCYHWSDAFYRSLVKKSYPHFSFHLGGANIGEYWSEHNVLVVTGKEGKFEEGVVIDPWRDSGKLYFSKIKEDRVYHWQHRAERECKEK
jgi:hypothetical protein